MASFLLCRCTNWILVFGSSSPIVTPPLTETQVRMVAFIGSTVQTAFSFAYSLGEYGRPRWEHCTSLPVTLLICHERLDF